jgi:hypothetical protein
MMPAQNSLPRYAAAMGLCLFAIHLAGAQPPAPGGLPKWSFDEIALTNGATLQGLILSDDPQGIRFQSVSRPPAGPTVTITWFLTKAEIARVKRLSDSDRAVLKDRLAELDPSGAGERKRMESLELVATDEWPPETAKRYESDYFTLVSTGSDELVRRSAVRLEQIYIAFTRFLPPAAKEARPTKIMLATDEGEYKVLLGSLGKANLLNPAVFDPASNRVLCGTEMKRLGSELQTARLHLSQQLAALSKYESEVAKLYRQPELQRYLDASALERRRVYAADAANGARFDRATSGVFAVLYHEAFHAYVGTFVYPPLKPDEVKAGRGTGELPRWLNEGLAQVFETAVVEAGELRADAPHRDRLNRVKETLRDKKGPPLVPLADLLLTGTETFLASHRDQRGTAERAYLTSWALAYYLTFERHLIGVQSFRKYLVAVNSGGDPRKAFEELVGQEVPVFERDWHAYLSRLQSDGTVAK